MVSEVLAQEIISNKVFAVNITGGEPLLVIKKIAPIIKKLSDGGVRVTMNSNLTLLTQETARLLKKCGVMSILVSIPSGNAKTCDQITGGDNSLAQIVRGISIAKKFDIRIFTNMVVSKINKNEIRETAKLVDSLGISHFAVTKASDPSENKGFTSEILDHREFNQMQETLEYVGSKFGLKTNSLEANPACAYGSVKPKQGYKFCNAGKTTCTIGFNGIVKPCNRVNISYGNIIEDGLQNCWMKMSDWRTDIWLPKACMRCRLKSICGGGCKADAIKAFGQKGNLT
jgi:radical SAM protein with 4Fe4S-binding SPASM domain